MERAVLADRGPAPEDLRPGARPGRAPVRVSGVHRLRAGGVQAAGRRRALDPVFKADHWQVCSALVADCYAYAGIRLEPGLRDLNLAGAAGLDIWVAQSA